MSQPGDGGAPVSQTPADHTTDPPAAAMFDADAELRSALVRVDWPATPLGSPDGWPQSLQTAVNILLSSRFSMWMAWGPDLTFFCNSAYRHATLGRKYPWALGRPAREVWAEIWADVGPRIEQVLSTGQATWDRTLQLFVERSGYVEESYHTFSYSPLRDDGGQVAGMLCVVSEDTDQVIAERRLATLRDLGSDPTAVRTEDQMLAFATRQLGLNKRDLPFALIYLFGPDGDARLGGVSGIESDHPLAVALPDLADAAVHGLGQPARSDSTLLTLNGELAAGLPTGAWPEPPTQALAVPLVQQGIAPYGILVAGLNRYRRLDDAYRGFLHLVAAHLAAGIGSARSYQAQLRRAEELAELDRAKTTFFSNISHELRTPLTLILGPVAEMRARADGFDAGTREELDVIHRNGLRLIKLVNTLLDFSRIQAGRMQAHYEPVDLAAVTADLASIFRSAVERAGLVLDVDCPPLDEPVYLDRDMWEKVVLNLLSNALKFTFEGSITVAVRRDAGDAVVTVSDTGIGVPAAEVPRLFERFRRIETPYARSAEGSGIGLALVKELVGMHGGGITVDSVDGAGTSFTIRLPLGTAHLPPDAVSPTESSRGGSGIAEPYVQEALRWVATDAATVASPDADVGLAPVGAFGQAWSAGPPPRVLIADDNIDMREYLARLLGAAGYLVESVSDGVQALAAVRAKAPDLVISDVMMPRLDGMTLVKELRADARTAAVPVVLVSAHAGQEASIEGLRAGADDYLVKPFVAAELLARVRANIELARLRNHQARWRSALIESTQEAFFVCDDRGAVTEINAAFTQILGYGQGGLPYQAPHPWWPDADNDHDSYVQLADVSRALRGETSGTYVVPAVHRDGHRIWIRTAVNHARDPDTGRRVVVGTFDDVTTEHYAVQRQSALADLNEQLAQADTVDDAVHAAVRGLRRLWRAHRVVALTFPLRAGQSGTPHSGWGPPSLVSDGGPALWADLPAATQDTICSLRDGQMLTADTTEHGAAGIALQHPLGVLVIWVELAERRPFSADDQTLLTVLAGRLGQGLQRVHQIDQQRETALALQHAMLGPSVLPAGFAVRYQPAARPLQVGGDWYDAVELEDGRVALIVGDCVGHGLAAATVMGQLRSACRALLLENPSPGSALEGLDRFAAQLPGARCTTAFCAVLDGETGELVYSSAGHPPAVLVHCDRTVQLLDDGRGIPLGLRLRSDRHRPEARLSLPARATLLLYTDGLVERRRVALDIGIARAADIVRGCGDTTLDYLASELMTNLAPRGGYQDDVAVLLYRQPPPLEMSFPAEVNQLGPTRAALRGWLARAGVNADQTLSILVAAGEAVANAIEHGHRHTSGNIGLRASVMADDVHITITDTGSWKAPQPAPGNHRGRGFTLMRGLMNGVTVAPGAAGTTVELRARITG
ncbi:PAS/PAC sensor hybrid histidine kinase [Mycobacterium bohemicum DSM 44277]|nr:PAS/PAC sensor hybrid histidine kinase [Mycobacterium bohemicum DSM 44277]